MVAIKETLRHVANDAPLPVILGEPDLNGVLEKAAPIYRKYWWSAHDAAHRAWIAAVRPLLAQYGAALSREVATSYGKTWPTTRLPVDLSVHAGRVGAYTTWPRHTTISSNDPGYHGVAALEMLFHEASHQWGTVLQSAIRKAADAQQKEVPAQLWHAVLFHNAGELTRRALLQNGIDYTEYAVQQDLYKSLCGEGCRERVARHWSAHLDAKLSIETALANLVAEWPTTE
jgi:hypothetical protein